MQARKIDANQNDIVRCMRQRGVSVIIINGAIDLIFGYRGRTELIEIKDGMKPKSRQKLTIREAKLHTEWRGLPIRTVTNKEQALAIFGIE